MQAGLRYNPRFALVALGMCFVIMTGGIDLSVGSVAAFSSVVAAHLSHYGLLPGLAGGLAAGLLAGRSLVGTEAGQLTWDRWKLRMPIAGKILHKGALSRACRSLALVLRSGVPVLEAMRLAAAVAENAFIERAVLEMRTSVERGETVLAACRKAGIFTPIVLQMVMVGEESGTLDAMLDEVGLMYQREVEYELKTISQQIEPILIFALGAMVLVLALGVFMPMWDLGKAALK